MSNLIRWNPIREMAAMQSAMDRIFENTWRNVQPAVAGNMLALDVHETDTAYTVVTAMPGLNPDDININLHEDVLTISGEIVKEEVEENTRVVLNERAYGKFTRSVRLPDAIDADNVEATYEDGILTLTLPKQPGSQPRQIRVNANKLIENGS